MKSSLGYIVIGIFVVILAISCFMKQPVSLYEGLDNNALFGEADTRQTNYLKTQDKYWDHRKFPQTAPGLSNDVKFKKLDSERKKLEDTNPSAHVAVSDIGKKIEKCKIINKTFNCAEVTEESGCG